MIAEDSMINIQPTNQSRLEQTDFNNLAFGREFSDHMFIMDYQDGKWQSQRIVPYQTLSMSPAVSVMHYGQAIFEGMKAFRTDDGKVNMFRPFENIKRFNLSAERMCMPTIPQEMFIEALEQLLNQDKDWIPKQSDASLYIRPFMYASDEYIGVKPSETYRFVIFTCPVSKYYKGAVKVKIETHYSRSVKGGTGFAKAAGNYAAALYPAKKAQLEGFDQLIWTDAQTHEFIEESGTMNIVFRTGNKIISPAVSETILRGITRDSVLQLAVDWGYEVEERPIRVSEIIDLLKAGKLDEAFGAGTAATIAPIGAISFKDVLYELPDHKTWEFANKAAGEMDKIKREKSPDTHQWNHFVM
jgi:branched-chain amino acid aminotransferase